MLLPEAVRLSSECLAVCESCKRCLGGTHSQRLWCIVETIGTDIAGVFVALGKECGGSAEECLTGCHLVLIPAGMPRKPGYDF